MAGEPDWGAVAEKFDLWLPHLAPVGDALIELLVVQPGQRVLDVACGTGEPALTLARRLGNAVEVEGADAAEGMVQAAQTKADREGLDMRFRAMPAEQLLHPDGSFDRVVCRFGVMLFENPLQGLKEMRRVLKPGGRAALAVWGRAEALPSFRWHHQAFSKRLPKEQCPPLERVAALGEPERLTALMEEAGFENVQVSRRTVHYRFDSFDHYWNLVEASQALAQQFAALPEEERERVRDEVAQMACEYQSEGGLVVPHEYLLAAGIKA